MNYIESDFLAISAQQSNGELPYFSDIIETEAIKLYGSDNSILSKPTKTNDSTKENPTSSETEIPYNTTQPVVIPIVGKKAKSISSTNSVECFGQQAPPENQTTVNALPAENKMSKGQTDNKKHDSSMPHLLSPSKSRKPSLKRKATSNQIEEGCRDKSSKQTRLEDCIGPTKETEMLMSPSKNKSKRIHELFITDRAGDTVDDSKILGTDKKDLCTDDDHTLSYRKEKQPTKGVGVGIDNTSNTTSFAKCLISTNQKLSLIHISRCQRIERCRSRWTPYQ